MNDLIKRADAIKAIEDLPNAYNGWSDAYDKAYIIGTLEDIPSAEPKRERCEYCKDGTFMGQRIMLCNDGRWHKIRFCPNCGARMEGADNETD